MRKRSESSSSHAITLILIVHKFSSSHSSSTLFIIRKKRREREMCVCYFDWEKCEYRYDLSLMWLCDTIPRYFILPDHIVIKTKKKNLKSLRIVVWFVSKYPVERREKRSFKSFCVISINSLVARCRREWKILITFAWCVLLIAFPAFETCTSEAKELSTMSRVYCFCDEILKRAVCVQVEKGHDKINKKKGAHYPLLWCLNHHSREAERKIIISHRFIDQNERRMTTERRREKILQLIIRIISECRPSKSTLPVWISGDDIVCASLWIEEEKQWKNIKIVKNFIVCSFLCVSPSLLRIHHSVDDEAGEDLDELKQRLDFIKFVICFINFHFFSCVFFFYYNLFVPFSLPHLSSPFCLTPRRAREPPHCCSEWNEKKNNKKFFFLDFFMEFNSVEVVTALLLLLLGFQVGENIQCS